MGFWDMLLSLVRTIRINDVIDMAIMAFLLYKVLYFLSRTGSGRALRGMLLLVVAALIAKRLNLYVFNFVFGKALELGVLILLIIFQPEVRAMLEKVGAVTKFIPGSDRSKELGSCIEEVVKACDPLSKTKTGALVVFERDNDLNEEIQTGVLIDVETRSILLQHIFDKNTILHDGAVIIRSERIYAARCRLPSSKRLDLPQRYGMRHRAALGMCEHSDAVVVIVSEQTGEISLAVNGEIYSNITLNELKTRLDQELLRTTDGDGKGDGLRAALKNTLALVRKKLAPVKEDENEYDQEDNEQ
jgi:diadenylate cyclase